MKSDNQHIKTIISVEDYNNTTTTPGAFKWSHTASDFGSVTRFSNNSIELTSGESLPGAKQLSIQENKIPRLITTDIESEFKKLTHKRF